MLRDVLTEPVTTMLIISAVVTVVGLVVWLLGLIVVVNGTSAQDRAEIIRAYAECIPRRIATHVAYRRGVDPSTTASQRRK